MPYAAYQCSDRIYDTCSGCEGRKTKGALFCKKCKSNKAVKWGACATCFTRIRAAYRQCRACYEKEREAVKPRCVDCGRSTKQYAHEYFAQRCWACEVKRRRSQPVRTCTVKHCGKVHMAKGLCRSHYQTQLPRDRRGLRVGGSLIGLLKELPCQLCGYSKMKSEAARLVPGGPYRPGNVMALCARCHREVDAGLTSPPTPLTAEEITASRPSLFSKQGFIGIFEDGRMVNGSPWPFDQKLPT